MVVGTIKPIKIEEELRNSYLDYAMSVIVARALPDIRDGLKPVQRRILYSMQQMGIRSNTAYKKCARIVGEVMGKYHPHGDAPVYEAMVRLAQDFSMRYPLVDGQGNFGSIDNDPPAAMRYTEARLAAIAEEMLVDIERETVNFTPNFDGTLEEPTVLPARLPNLLVNGATGIAVGMATNIPPHNLGEVCDAINYLIDNPEATLDDIVKIIPGPDFPTGGILIGQEGVLKAYGQGQGRFILQAKHKIETTARGRQNIIITELPYQVNKAALVERIADLARDKKIEGIAELRDESDREGIRVVIELKRDVLAEVVLNNLFKHTALQSAFSVNFLALVDGQPRPNISLKEALQLFIEFRRDVIVRRTQYELRQAQARAHILEGLKKALDNLDAVIALIRQSPSAEAAREGLMSTFALSQVQAQAILDMQLRRLAALERQKIEEEYAELLKTIAYLEDLLANPRKVMYLIQEETKKLKEKYADPRRTVIQGGEITVFSDADLIPHQDVVVTLSQRGYIKRVPCDTFRLQHRGGRGIQGTGAKETDSARLLLVADTHDNLLFFTNRGKVFQWRTYNLPADASRTARGTPLMGLIEALDPKEQVTEMVDADTTPGLSMIMATSRGEIKKTSLHEFANIRSSGLIAMDLEEGDDLVSVRQAAEGEDVVLVTRNGRAVRFSVDKLRSASRASGGVRAVRLDPGDAVVSMDVISPNGYLLTISQNGYGKLTDVSRYPRHGRGTHGVLTFKINDKTGDVADSRLVKPTQELLLISVEGVVLRTSMEELRISSRHTQGTRIMNLDEGDRVAAIAVLERQCRTPVLPNEGGDGTAR
ncbi:MAG: DNA gyrase subunit A [Chloroflexi bacterium]|nr:DNA gyrase subunit A [Chloroflexota bacterium]